MYEESEESVKKYSLKKKRKGERESERAREREE